MACWFCIVCGEKITRLEDIIRHGVCRDCAKQMRMCQVCGQVYVGGCLNCNPETLEPYKKHIEKLTAK